MTDSLAEPVRQLLERGVRMSAPHMVYVDPAVPPNAVAPGVVLHPGTRLTGATISIGPECVIGGEAPATVADCQLGRGVQLAGGYFNESTFLDGARMGSGGHVRPGTLLEEGASGAHAVGFKQTVLLPFVTTGSLVNFCDCLMAGGSDAHRHSEVGSSYIHFNFTPHGDKATASLIGDVPRGVMLEGAPIFLGGQGGLVGPARIGFGTVIPAGVVWRGDVLAERRLVEAGREGQGVGRDDDSAAGRSHGPVVGRHDDPMVGWNDSPSAASQSFQMGAYRAIDRIVRNNLIYIGNIRALTAWYLLVRRPFMEADPYTHACLTGALARLEHILGERIRRLADLAERMLPSIKLVTAASGGTVTPYYVAQQLVLADGWPSMAAHLARDPLESNAGASGRQELLAALELGDRGDYLTTVRSLAPAAKAAGTAWLQAIVDEVAHVWH